MGGIIVTGTAAVKCRLKITVLKQSLFQGYERGRQLLDTIQVNKVSNVKNVTGYSVYLAKIVRNDGQTEMTPWQ